MNYSTATTANELLRLGERSLFIVFLFANKIPCVYLGSNETDFVERGQYDAKTHPTILASYRPRNAICFLPVSLDL